MTPDEETIAVGDSVQFAVVVTDGENVVEDPEIVWALTDPSVAVIDGEGMLTGIAEGVTDVIA